MLIAAGLLMVVARAELCMPMPVDLALFLIEVSVQYTSPWEITCAPGSGGVPHRAGDAIDVIFRVSLDGAGFPPLSSQVGR